MKFLIKTTTKPVQDTFS